MMKRVPISLADKGSRMEVSAGWGGCNMGAVIQAKFCFCFLFWIPIVHKLFVLWLTIALYFSSWKQGGNDFRTDQTLTTPVSHLGWCGKYGRWRRAGGEVHLS